MELNLDILLLISFSLLYSIYLKLETCSRIHLLITIIDLSILLSKAVTFDFSTKVVKL